MQTYIHGLQDLTLVDGAGYLVQQPGSVNCAIISLLNALIFYKKFDISKRFEIEKDIHDKYPPIENAYTVQQMFLVADYLGLVLNTTFCEEPISAKTLDGLPFIIAGLTSEAEFRTTGVSYDTLLPIEKQQELINFAAANNLKSGIKYVEGDLFSHAFFVSKHKELFGTETWLTSNLYMGTTWINSRLIKRKTFFTVKLK